MRSTHLGIDLGTTNSTAAAFDGEQITLIRNSQGGPITPSVIRYDARGNATIGVRARRFLDSDPANTRTEWKRLMGSDHLIPFPAAKLNKRPEELAAALLRSLRDDTEQQLGFPPVTAVISVPALFELPQTRATAEAARLAGFTKVEMIQEPVASAIAAGWSAEADDPRPWLVYDLGGGTFDVSLLDSQEGLLRVVGHDGDNFLGGRDFDGAVVAWALDALQQQGHRLDAADPALQPALRKLRHAAEEAKIELSRASVAGLLLPELIPGVEVDLELDRATFERLTLPLVDRSIEVCRRLMAAHGVRDGGIGHIVLVGGPTAMGWLRDRVSGALGAGFQAGLDPMTLVAQGAAIFAATSGLDARGPRTAAPQPDAPRGPSVWLQYPSMTADLSPFVVGRLSPADKIAQVRILDSAGSEVGPPEPVEAEGTFAISVSLKPRVVNTLQIEGSREGRWIALSPPTLSIVHGLTLQDPPLSRTVGLALADNRVHVYFERGAPLPIRRTFTHNTVETVSPGEDFALKVPIVQGEFRASHLCRLVGVLEVPARGLKRSLPVGSPIEVTLELDRGGRLSARARLEDGLIFEQVATLIVPQLSAEALTQMVAELRPRLQKAAMEASRQLDPTAAARLGRAESLLEDAARGIHLGKGGDADATERARRQLIEVDEALASAEADAAWPALEAEVQILLANAVVLVGRTGSPAEKELLTDAQSRLRGALRTRNLSEVERLRTLIIELRHNAFIRTPDAWPHLFRTAVSHQGDMTDTRKAAALIRRGEDELRRADLPALEATTRALWELWPPDVQERRRSHGSGIR